MPLDKDELEEIVEELSEYRGRHTELISVYVSAGYDVNAAQRQLEAETSTAKNIKSSSTKKNVTDALEKIIRHLKGLKKTPKNGLALFSGNVAESEGQKDIRLWAIEPPIPLKTRLYRCDKDFVLEPLKKQLEVEEVYGLIVMDRKEATIGLLEGKRINVIHKMTSGVPSKVRAGGQCLSPETIVNTKNKSKIKLKDIKKGDYIKGFDFNQNKQIYSKVLKKWKVNKKDYYKISLTKYPPIISSGNHLFFVYENEKIVEKTAGKLINGDDLVFDDGSRSKISLINHEISDIELIDLEVENKNFIANSHVVHNSAQRFHRITEGLTKKFYKRIAKEAKRSFFKNPKLKGIILGGPVPTKDEFLEGEYLVTNLQEKVIGRVDIGDTDESGLKELVQKSQKILADQEMIYEKKILEKLFRNLGEKPELSALKQKPVERALKYGAVDTLVLSKSLDKPLLKELKKKAKSISSNVEVVSTETEEGDQFKNMSGIAAILRFQIGKRQNKK